LLEFRLEAVLPSPPRGAPPASSKSPPPLCSPCPSSFPAQTTLTFPSFPKQKTSTMPADLKAAKKEGASMLLLALSMGVVRSSARLN
jgi:hypothetical protein